MATKFSNDQSRFFNQLLKSNDLEKTLNEAFQKIDDTQYFKPEFAEVGKQHDKNRLLEVKAFFDKIKFLEKPEIYAVNTWGYGQTNYENLMVLGQVGASMVCVLDDGYSDVFTISKSKYINKDKWTNLDKGVRSTNWREPYTNEAIQENFMYNAYYGH